MLKGFGAAAAGLMLVTWIAFGSAVLWQYPSYVLWADHVRKFPWNSLHRNITNIRGLVLTLLPQGWGAADQIIVVVLSVALLIVAIRMWLRAGEDEEQRTLAFSANLVATVLVSYHTGVQDMSLLLLPTLVLLDFTLRRWADKSAWVWIVTGLMFCSPVYLLFVLRLGLAAMLTLLALVLLFFLAAGLDRAQRQSGERLIAESP